MAAPEAPREPPAPGAKGPAGEWLDVAGACEALEVSEQDLLLLVAQEALPAIRSRGVLRFLRKDVEDLAKHARHERAARMAAMPATNKQLAHISRLGLRAPPKLTLTQAAELIHHAQSVRFYALAVARQEWDTTPPDEALNSLIVQVLARPEVVQGIVEQVDGHLEALAALTADIDPASSNRPVRPPKDVRWPEDAAYELLRRGLLFFHPSIGATGPAGSEEFAEPSPADAALFRRPLQIVTGGTAFFVVSETPDRTERRGLRWVLAAVAVLLAALLAAWLALRGPGPSPPPSVKGPQPPVARTGPAAETPPPEGEAPAPAPSDEAPPPPRIPPPPVVPPPAPPVTPEPEAEPAPAPQP
jgi:hypothetical protein